MLGGLVETVDPDAAEAELARRLDVVEEARRHVGVGVAVGGRGLEESLPMGVGGLVRLDVLGDDRNVDRHAELPLRRGNQVSVRVREDGELPAAVTDLGERVRHLGERRPAGQGARERAGLALGELDALLLSQLLECERRDYAVRVERP
jgi:hypothetical protein